MRELYSYNQPVHYDLSRIQICTEINQSITAKIVTPSQEAALHTTKRLKRKIDIALPCQLGCFVIGSCQNHVWFVDADVVMKVY